MIFIIKFSLIWLTISKIMVQLNSLKVQGRRIFKFERELSLFNPKLNINCETPDLGGISLALRGSGAFGTTFGRLRRLRWSSSGAPVGAPQAPILETAAFGGGKSNEKIKNLGQKKKKLGRLQRP